MTFQESTAMVDQQHQTRIEHGEWIVFCLGDGRLASCCSSFLHKASIPVTITNQQVPCNRSQETLIAYTSLDHLFGYQS